MTTFQKLFSSPESRSHWASNSHSLPDPFIPFQDSQESRAGLYVKACQSSIDFCLYALVTARDTHDYDLDIFEPQVAGSSPDYLVSRCPLLHIYRFVGYLIPNGPVTHQVHIIWPKSEDPHDWMLTVWNVGKKLFAKWDNFYMAGLVNQWTEWLKTRNRPSRPTLCSSASSYVPSFTKSSANSCSSSLLFSRRVTCIKSNILASWSLCEDDALESWKYFSSNALTSGETLSGKASGWIAIFQDVKMFNVIENEVDWKPAGTTRRKVESYLGRIYIDPYMLTYRERPVFAATCSPHSGRGSYTPCWQLPGFCTKEEGEGASWYWFCYCRRSSWILHAYNRMQLSEWGVCFGLSSPGLLYWGRRLTASFWSTRITYMCSMDFAYWYALRNVRITKRVISNF